MPRLPARAAFTVLGALALSWSLAKRSGQPRRPRTSSGPEPAFAPFVQTPYAPPRSALVVSAILLLGIAAGYAGSAYRDMRERERLADGLTGGRLDRAEDHFIRYGCAGCHTIPGISRANGLVGPPLDSMAGRIYIAGMLPNSPENLVRWIAHPREVNPKTAMPVTGISEAEARDVAAYLYALK